MVFSLALIRMTNYFHLDLSGREELVLLAWPTLSNPGAPIRFEKAADRHRFVESLNIERNPKILSAKFARAGTHYPQHWIDFSVVKADEFAALIALGPMVMDRYADASRRLGRLEGLLRLSNTQSIPMAKATRKFRRSYAVGEPLWVS